jgi:hypothetical protein
MVVTRSTKYNERATINLLLLALCHKPNNAILNECVLRDRVQNGSGAHPASYPMGTRGSFSGGKAAWA